MPDDYVPRLPPPVPRRKIGTPSPTRATTTERGYGHEWQKLRAIKLQANPICELALPGCASWADCVHHLDHDTQNTSPENLCSACGICHLKYHANNRRRKRDG